MRFRPIIEMQIQQRTVYQRKKEAGQSFKRKSTKKKKKNNQCNISKKEKSEVNNISKKEKSEVDKKAGQSQFVREKISVKSTRRQVKVIAFLLVEFLNKNLSAKCNQCNLSNVRDNQAIYREEEKRKVDKNHDEDVC